jgi:hypothetical protein
MAPAPLPLTRRAAATAAAASGRPLLAAPRARRAAPTAAPPRAAPPGGDSSEPHHPVAQAAGPGGALAPGAGRAKGSVAVHVASLAAGAFAGVLDDAPPGPLPASLLQQLLAGAPHHVAPMQRPSAAAAAPPPAPAVLPPLEIRTGFELDFELGELLGRGTFGEVRVAARRADAQQFAVKTMAKRAGGRDARDAILAEVRAGRWGAHPNV